MAIDKLVTDTILSDTLKDKQEKLVSGINIKTINGVSILGSGNLQSPSVSSPLYYDYNNSKLNLSLSNQFSSGTSTLTINPYVLTSYMFRGNLEGAYIYLGPMDYYEKRSFEAWTVDAIQQMSGESFNSFEEAATYLSVIWPSLTSSYRIMLLQKFLRLVNYHQYTISVYIGTETVAHDNYCCRPISLDYTTCSIRGFKQGETTPSELNTLFLDSSTFSMSIYSAEVYD